MTYRTAPYSWLKDFIARLDRLRKSQPIETRTHERFAKWVRIKRSTMTSWFSASGQPKAYDLFLVGKHTGVSLDWLVFGTDAAGNATPEPQFRGQSRDMRTLEDDLAVSVWRELRARGVRIPDVTLSIYPPSLFREVIEIVKRDVVLWSKHTEEEELLHDAISALSQALDTPTAEGERKAAWKAARKGLIQLVENRDVASLVVVGSSLRFALPQDDEDGHLFSGRIGVTQPRSVFAPAD